MKTSLPKFEGQPVSASRLVLSGNSDTRVGALVNDEEVFVIIRGIVTGINHGEVGEVFTRTHKVKATDVILLERKMGEQILEEAAMLADERFGIRHLFNPGEDA